MPVKHSIGFVTHMQRADSPSQIAVFIKPSFHPSYGVAPEIVIVDVPSLADERPEQREGRRCHGERRRIEGGDGVENGEMDGDRNAVIPHYFTPLTDSAVQGKI